MQDRKTERHDAILAKSTHRTSSQILSLITCESSKENELKLDLDLQYMFLQENDSIYQILTWVTVFFSAGKSIDRGVRRISFFALMTLCFPT